MNDDSLQYLDFIELVCEFCNGQERLSYQLSVIRTIGDGNQQPIPPHKSQITNAFHSKVLLAHAQPRQFTTPRGLGPHCGV